METVHEAVDRLNIDIENHGIEYIQNTIDHPDFEHAGRVHDWRNHVPEWIPKSWSSLSTETRIVIYLMADYAAGEEAWD